MDNQINNSRYGKRPLWQWILLYVVIGGVAYGLIYHFVLNNNGGGYNYNATTPYAAPTPTPQNQLTSPSPSTPTTPTTNSTSKPVSSTPTAKRFAVNGNDMNADLTTITVARGTPVAITFGADAQGTYHGGLDFRSSVVNTGPIAPGSTKTVTFTAEQSFSFQPYWPTTNIAKPYMISVVVR